MVRMVSERPDDELLADPDPEAFGAFYDRHLAAVTAYVGRRARRADLTFDVVAETFARALEHRARYDPERGPGVALASALAALPAEQREAVLRRVVAEEPYPLIAGRVGCSEQVIRQRVSRGLAALRRCAVEEPAPPAASPGAESPGGGNPWA
jgi:RNA polymerase sigma-70 factor, ECF subfamily